MPYEKAQIIFKHKRIKMTAFYYDGLTKVTSAAYIIKACNLKYIMTSVYIPIQSYHNKSANISSYYTLNNLPGRNHHNNFVRIPIYYASALKFTINRVNPRPWPTKKRMGLPSALNQASCCTLRPLIAPAKPSGALRPLIAPAKPCCTLRRLTPPSTPGCRQRH